MHPSPLKFGAIYGNVCKNHLPKLHMPTGQPIKLIKLPEDVFGKEANALLVLTEESRFCKAVAVTNDAGENSADMFLNTLERLKGDSDERLQEHFQGLAMTPGLRSTYMGIGIEAIKIPKRKPETLTGYNATIETSEIKGKTFRWPTHAGAFQTSLLFDRFPLLDMNAPTGEKP